MAVKKGFFKTIKYFITEAKAEVNIRSAKGATPLMYAAKHGKMEIVQYLCDHGADVSLKDKAGKCAKHYAVPEGVICKYLTNIELSTVYAPG